jgi:hypothetical protein
MNNAPKILVLCLLQLISWVSARTKCMIQLTVPAVSTSTLKPPRKFVAELTCLSTDANAARVEMILNRQPQDALLDV